MHNLLHPLSNLLSNRVTSTELGKIMAVIITHSVLYQPGDELLIISPLYQRPKLCERGTDYLRRINTSEIFE